MTRNNTQTSHYAYIDFLRTVSIVLVILLHCIGGYLFDSANIGKTLWVMTAYANEVCRIGVPLFFMMSGFLLLNKKIDSVGAFYKHRFLKIALPFLLYDTFYYLFLPSGNEPRSFVGWLRELINNGSAYHLWFIYSILILYLFVPFIRKITEKCTTGELILFLLLCTFQTTLKPLYNILFSEKAYLYLSDDGFVGYLGYMLLGYILGKTDIPRKIRVLLYTCGLLSLAFCPIIVMNALREGRGVWLNGGYTINHYIEAAAVFVLCKTVICRPCAVFSFLSALSMDTYFIHVFILEKVKKLPIDASPSVKIGLQILAFVILGFLWAFVKTRTVFFVKKIFGKEKADK